jgi:hypothetical protein
MTLLDVAELGEYWAEHPPVHILVAGFVGYKGAESRDKPNWRDEMARAQMPSAELNQVAQQLGMTPGTLDGLPPAIFDVDELMRQRPN